jgi:hypothetical protein
MLGEGCDTLGSMESEFVEVGNIIINLAVVTHVRVSSSGGIRIYLPGTKDAAQVSFALKDRAAQDFLSLIRKGNSYRKIST